MCRSVKNSVNHFSKFFNCINIYLKEIRLLGASPFATCNKIGFFYTVLPYHPRSYKVPYHTWKKSEMSPRRIQWPNLYAVYPRSNGAGKIEPNVRVEAVNSIPNVLLPTRYWIDCRSFFRYIDFLKESFRLVNVGQNPCVSLCTPHYVPGKIRSSNYCS